MGVGLGVGVEIICDMPGQSMTRDDQQEDDQDHGQEPGEDNFRAGIFLIAGQITAPTAMIARIWKNQKTSG